MNGRKVVTGRKKVVTGRKKVVTGRKKVVTGRKKVVMGRKKVVMIPLGHRITDASGVTFAVYQKPLDFGTTSSLLRLIVVSKSNLVLLRYIIFLSGIQVFCVCVWRSFLWHSCCFSGDVFLI